MIIVLIFLPLTIISQELNKKIVDEFTGNVELSTTWENLFKQGSGMSQNLTVCKFRISKVNDHAFLEIKLIVKGGQVFAVDESLPLSIILENGSLLEFNPIEFYIAHQGGGSIGLSGSALWGAHIKYIPIEESQFHQMMENKVTKVRINTDIGFVQDELKPKEQEKLQNSIKLLF